MYEPYFGLVGNAKRKKFLILIFSKLFPLCPYNVPKNQDRQQHAEEARKKLKNLTVGAKNFNF